MRVVLAVPALLLWLTAAVSASAAQQQSMTLYLDGAVVEETAASSKTGTISVSLPAAMQPGSLRVRQLSGAAIDRVEILPSGRPAAREAETARLVERRDQLGDRLRALATKEEIFKAAAKSQSGKAPRKTKANPEPLATIRKGTDYALAQLEEVYRVRRKAENELKEVSARLAALKEQLGTESIARIVLKGKTGKVGVSYIRADLKWLPQYDFRLDGAGSAEMTMRVRRPHGAGGKLAIVPALLSDAAARGMAVSGETDAAVASFPIAASGERFVPGPRSSVTFTVKNTSAVTFPEGVATCYWKGEYLGTTTFPGFAPGESREVAAGK